MSMIEDVRAFLASCPLLAEQAIHICHTEPQESSIGLQPIGESAASTDLAGFLLLDCDFFLALRAGASQDRERTQALALLEGVGRWMQRTAGSPLPVPTGARPTRAQCDGASLYKIDNNGSSALYRARCQMSFWQRGAAAASPATLLKLGDDTRPDWQVAARGFTSRSFLPACESGGLFYRMDGSSLFPTQQNGQITFSGFSVTGDRVQDYLFGGWPHSKDGAVLSCIEYRADSAPLTPNGSLFQVRLALSSETRQTPGESPVSFSLMVLNEPVVGTVLYEQESGTCTFTPAGAAAKGGA